MNELKEEIEEARARVAHCRIRAERPSARLEDEYALEKARNRLLTLELKDLKLGQSDKNAGRTGFRARVDQERQAKGPQGNIPSNGILRTKRKQISLTARQRAETKFAALQKGSEIDKEGR